MARINQRAFSGGVISPSMMARYDDVKYQTGLAVCRNFICLPQGALENRPGFSYVASAKIPGSRTRLVAFNYSVGQTMVLEFGAGYVRFHTQGKTLMANGSPYEVATPYAAEDLDELYFCQSSDVMTITHQKYTPRELRRYGALDWRLATINFSPRLATPTGVAATRTSTAAEDQNADKYVWYYKVTALNEDKTEESLPSVAVSCRANLYATGTVVTISWNAVSGAKFYRVYKAEGGLYGYIGDTEGTSITDENIAPEKDVTPPYYSPVFTEAGGISSVSVTNGGSGYVNYERGVADYRGNLVPTSQYLGTATGDGTPWQKIDRNEKKYMDVSGDAIRWTLRDYYRYPDYPIDAIKARARVVDDAYLGTGATVEPILELSRHTTTETDYDSEGSSSTYTVYVSQCTLIGFRITSRGQNYRTPYIEVASFPGRLRGSDLNGNGIVVVRRFALTTQSSSVKLAVRGGNGSGAVIRPIVTNGAITNVIVERAGANYTNPSVYFVDASGGSGATFSVSASGNGENPRCSGYFEQRRVFASTTMHPQHVWMTRTGTESNMTYRLPSQADDRISFALASQENSPIMHLVPMARLILLTSSSEWRTDTLNSDALTPESISVRIQSAIGASSVQPVVINNSMLYCAARGGHIREFSYNYNAGGFISGDISIRAAHLFDGQRITQIAFAKAPQPILWCVTEEGRLLGLTYVPEQQIGAWHEHITDGAFESVCTVAEGDEDVVYVVVRRTINGNTVRYIERMNPRSAGIFVDAAGVYNGAETTTVSGLTWLEGRSVSILADGAVEPRQTVVNGRITLEHPARHIVVGLPYDSDMETLPVVTQLASNALSHGRRKALCQVWLRLFESSGVWVGPDFDTLTEVKQRTTEPMGSPPDFITGEVSAVTRGKWTADGQVCVRQSDPLPITIVGLTAEIRVEGE